MKDYRYCALLRGINVGGNSIIKMAELRDCFEKLGFKGAQTYIQSGNVVFESKDSDQAMIEFKIESALHKTFNYQTKIVLLSQLRLNQIVKNLPKSWVVGDTSRRYNVIFLRPAVDSPKIIEGLNPKPGIEEVDYQPGVLYCSAGTGDLSRTSMAKLSANPVYKEVTVRNLNTTLKLSEIINQNI